MPCAGPLQSSPSLPGSSSRAGGWCRLCPAFRGLLLVLPFVAARLMNWPTAPSLSLHCCRVRCTVEADLFHKLLCVHPLKRGFETCDHEVWGLAWLPQPAPGLHNHRTLKAQTEPGMEQTGCRGQVEREGAHCPREGRPAKPSTPAHGSCVSASFSGPCVDSEWQ